MGLVFKEQLVQKEKTSKDTMKKYLYILICIIVSILVIRLVGFYMGTITTFIFALIAFYFITKLNVEYEYIYTEGILDVDVIYNQSRRKRLFSGKVKDFEYMTHIDNKNLLARYDNLKTKDYSSGKIYGNTYVFVKQHGDNKYKFIIEPEKDILEAMKLDLTELKFKGKQ